MVNCVSSNPKHNKKLKGTLSKSLYDKFLNNNLKQESEGCPAIVLAKKLCWGAHYLKLAELNEWSLNNSGLMIPVLVERLRLGLTGKEDVEMFNDSCIGREIKGQVD